MIRHLKRYLAIRDYARRLSHELVRRFGKRSFYTVEQVTQAVQRGRFSEAFIAHAHAAFCSQKDFEAHYQSLGEAVCYKALRRVFGQRYLYGQLEFDAVTIARRFKPDDEGDFYESHRGEDYPIQRG